MLNVGVVGNGAPEKLSKKVADVEVGWRGAGFCCCEKLTGVGVALLVS